MKCILCYSSQLCFVIVTFKQGLILYNTTNIIITLQKHVNANCSLIAKMFEEEVNRSLKGEMEKQPTKKRLNPYGSAIVNFFVAKYPFQDHQKKLSSCNHSIYDYLPLFVVYNNHWLFLQLFIAFCCVYNYTYD